MDERTACRPFVSSKQRPQMLAVQVKQEPEAPSSLPKSCLQMVYGWALKPQDPPFFPPVNTLAGAHSLTCVPVNCLRLQSSACNKPPSAIRGEAGALEAVSEVEQCHDHFVNLKTAHEAKVRKPHEVLTKSDFSSCPGAPRGMQTGSRENYEPRSVLG